MAKTPKPPYASVSDVEAFFVRVQTIAEPKSPKKVDSGWVENYQFKTAHPAAIPSMLHWLGVINDEGQSTGVWNDLRVEGTRQTTLGRLVKEAYKAVFEAIEVENATARDVRGAFVSAYAIGDPARQINCFLALCQQAGIKTAVEATTRESKQSGDTKPKPKPKATPIRGGTKTRSVQQRKIREGASATSGISVTLNVEIPANWSEDQIRARIAAVTRALESADASDS